MLSTTLKRALLEARSQLPPTFLLPWAASITTASTATSTRPQQPSQPKPRSIRSKKLMTVANENHTFVRLNLKQPKQKTQQTQRSRANSTSLAKLSPSVLELLPLMRSQSPHYITLHIHGNPYLVTQGDTVRLPFLMHGVEPGDILRLNRAIYLGSRDYTLKAPAPSPKPKSPTASSTTVLDPTTGSLASHSKVMPNAALSPAQASLQAPHYIPHIAKGKNSYVDDRLFVCRAVVMGVESEPLRIKEKTKRRQRHVRKVKSKHRYTILKIKELRIKSPDEAEEIAE